VTKIGAPRAPIFIVTAVKTSNLTLYKFITIINISYLDTTYYVLLAVDFVNTKSLCCKLKYSLRCHVCNARVIIYVSGMVMSHLSQWSRCQFMNFPRLTKQLGRGLDSHSRHGCPSM
jgi:hypothetical protein